MPTKRRPHANKPTREEKQCKDRPTNAEINTKYTPTDCRTNANTGQSAVPLLISFTCLASPCPRALLFSTLVCIASPYLALLALPCLDRLPCLALPRHPLVPQPRLASPFLPCLPCLAFGPPASPRVTFPPVFALPCLALPAWWLWRFGSSSVGSLGGENRFWCRPARQKYSEFFILFRCFVAVLGFVPVAFAALAVRFCRFVAVLGLCPFGRYGSGR